MGYMTTFAIEEAKVAIHSSLPLLLGWLAVLSEFRGEIGPVAIRRTGKWSSGVVQGQPGVVQGQPGVVQGQPGVVVIVV